MAREYISFPNSTKSRQAGRKLKCPVDSCQLAYGYHTITTSPFCPGPLSRRASLSITALTLRLAFLSMSVLPMSYLDSQSPSAVRCLDATESPTCSRGFPFTNARMTRFLRADLLYR